MNKKVKHIIIGIAIVGAIGLTYCLVKPKITTILAKTRAYKYPVDVKEIEASDKAKDLIKSYEGLRLKAYKVGSDKWTIGYGHTLNVKSGQAITEKQAKDFLEQDIKVAEGSIKRNVKVPLFQNEYDALVSLIFNIGSGNFYKSDVRKYLNEGNKEKASQSFMDHVYSKGKKLNGLVKRRNAEMQIFSENLGTNKI